MFDRASLKLGLDKAVLQSMGPKDLNAVCTFTYIVDQCSLTVAIVASVIATTCQQDMSHVSTAVSLPHPNINHLCIVGLE